MKRKVNKRKVLVLILMIIFILMFCLSIIKIFNYLKNNKENRQIQKVISESITVMPKKDIKYEVDFSSLKKQNSDTVAYLKVNNTNIDYVVLRGENNIYYLNHNFNRNENVSGWIFADYHNKFDGNDKNIVIYGHNTWDGSMFGSLKNVLDDKWNQNEDNQKIMLVTDSGINYYQVFSVYTIEVEDYYISTEFTSDEEFRTFVKRLKFRSIYPYQINVLGNDKILTLSTCTGDGKRRVVLHAKLISE